MRRIRLTAAPAAPKRIWRDLGSDRRHMAAKGNDLFLGHFRTNHPLVLRHAHRLQHLSIVGLTGTGKSRYLEYLVRQDIQAWPRTQCGVLVVDPHGEMFDGLMAWVATNKLTHLPLVPVDLRRQDQIISYNVLRERAAEPSVVIDNFVKAMAYVWGQQGTDQTPLFERWASNLLYALYYRKKTLADAAHLFTPEGLVIADGIEDPMIRRDWLWARRNWKEFETAASSSVNRFRRFLLNPILRAIFGQSEMSLDLNKALDEGHIVLVSLARNGGKISRENADLFATLLLADLWTAADERGKGEHVKPFYCYIDEFQRFLTPTMAESLAEARGFGIGMTMANQFPRQILNGGVYGSRIYDEVMENTRSKIVFRLGSRANLEPVAEQLFMNTFDPEQVKYQHYSTTLLGHELKYMPSYGQSHVTTVGRSEERSLTSGTNHTLGTNRSHTDSSSYAVGRNWSDTVGETETKGSSWSDALATGGSRGRSCSRSSGGNRSRASTTNTSASESFGVSGRNLEGRGEPDFSEIYDDDEAARRQSWQISNSNGQTESNGQSSQWGEASGSTAGENWNSSQSRGGSRGHSVTQSHTEGGSETHTIGESDTYGTSEAFGTSNALACGTSASTSQAAGTSTTTAPMLFPILGKEAAQPLFRSIEEQLFIAMAKIARLKDREAYVLTADMIGPALIRTPNVTRPLISRTCTEVFAGWYQRQSGLALPLDEALARVLSRDRNLYQESVSATTDEDTGRPRRRLNAVRVAATRVPEAAEPE